MPDKHCLIVGGGPAGMAASLELSEKGFSVDLFERSGRLKGNAEQFICKAVDQCLACGACHLDQLADQVTASPRIRISFHSELISARDCGDRFETTIRTNDSQKVIASQYLALATGFLMFNPRLKPAYRYGFLPNVITGHELELMLHEQGTIRLSHLERAPESAAFIQCVGSRDTRLGAGYCSQVCCGFGVRMAGLLNSRFPEMDITVYYMDLQSSSPRFDADLKRLRKSVRFVRGLPGEILPGTEGRVLIRTESDGSNRLENREYDMAVLSAGMWAQPLPDKVMSGLCITRNAHGFIETPSSRPELTAVGAAVRPMNIADSIAHARHQILRMIETE